jgi:protein-S-isoprenylcysteine O-methyltransferase Ste14
MSELRITDLIYKWRVRSGLFSAILAIVFARPTMYSLIGGAGITAIGIAIRIWACGYLRKEKELTTSGPYRFTRNPLYLGSLILGISTVVACNSLWVFAIFMANFLIFYPVVVCVERQRMSQLFPEKYNEYSKKVPLFFPTLKPKPSCDSLNPFSWTLYKQNKENRALIGTVIFYTCLIIKMSVF